MLRHTRILRVIAAVFLILSAGLSYAQPPSAAVAAGPEPVMPPIKYPKDGNPKLDSQLNQLVSRQTGKPMPGFAQPNSIQSANESVRVIIESSANQTDQLKKAAGNFGKVEASYGNLIQITVPVAQLAAVANVTGVRLVRTPYKPVEETVSEGVSLIGGDTWHSANLTGAGVKIGIIDGGFSGFLARQAAGELPASINTWWAPSIGNEGSSVHGTACAEIIYDIAPGAQFFFANIGTDVELSNAVDWMIGQHVDIISHSMGWDISGPGDGTGNIDQAVDRARANGILWVNAAGNSAQRHWQGPWINANGNQYNEFVPGDETNNINVTIGDPITILLKWDDPWGASGNDYDLLLFNNVGSLVALSADTQDGNDYPTEGLGYTATYTGTYYVAVGTLGTPAPKNFHLYSWYHEFQYQTASGSLTLPADSPNAMAMGAIRWSTPTVLEYFSSQGPTKDGRIKPDLVAPDGVSVSTPSYSPFYGTSASTPHGAGAAALVKQLYPSYTPAQVQAFLESSAVDLGSAGKDNLYGSGRLSLSILSPTVTTENAASVNISSALLSGNLTSLGSAVSANISFQWGLNPGVYTAETTIQTVSANGTFSTNLTGLNPGITYYFRAKAVSAYGSSYGTEKSFTTSTTPPSVTTDSATNIGFYSAHLNGTLASLGTASSADISFQWGPSSGGYTANTTEQIMGGAGIFSANLTSLSSNTTYYYRAKAVGQGTSYGTEKNFTTPLVTTDNATSVTLTSARLNGTLLGTTSSNNVSFQWGTSSGTYTANTTGEIISGTGPFSSNLTGLSANTTYYYRAKAVGDDTGYGIEKSFATLTTPSVVTDNATSIGFTSARLNGTLSWLGTASSNNASFQWGTTPGNLTLETEIVAMNLTGTFSANLTGLSANTTYYYRAKAVGDGTGYGAEKNFMTLSPPAVSTATATNVGYFSATLNGNLTSLGTASPVYVVFSWGTNSGNYTLATGMRPMNLTGAFSIDLTGFSANTTYYYRVTAYGHGDSSGNETSFTTLPITPPSVTTANATNIATNAALLSGNLTSLDAGSSANVSFQWGTTSGNLIFETELVSVSLTGAFSANLTGLNPGTTYYFRAKAVGYGTGLDAGIHGTGYGAEKSFTTTTTPPSVTTDNATNISYFSARLNGNLTSKGTASSANVSFRWGTSSGTYPFETEMIAMNLTGAFSANLTGLSANTTYYYRARASGHGDDSGSEKSFTTLPTTPPTIYGGPVGLGIFSAQPQSYLTNLGTASSVNVSFQWGLTSGSLNSETPPQTTNAPGVFVDTLSGLSANTTYYYRAKAAGHGTSYSNEINFTTMPTTPLVITDNATSITSGSARLNGTLTSLGAASSNNVSFQWGTSSGNYTAETSIQSINITGGGGGGGAGGGGGGGCGGGGVGCGGGGFYSFIGGLSANTTYYYRAKAVGNGAGYGTEKSFVTGVPAPPFNRFVYLGMNTQMASMPFSSNATVREAAYLLLDRQRLATLGSGARVVSIVTPSVSNPNIDRLQDVAQARQLLRDAGYPNGFRTTLTVPNEDWALLAANEIRTQLAVAGIDATINITAPATFQAQLTNHSLEFFLARTVVHWENTPELLGRLLLSNGSENYTGYSNASFDGFDSFFASGAYGKAESLAFTEPSGFATIPLMWYTDQRPPMVSTANAADITWSTARLNGDLVSLGMTNSANVSFQYTWGSVPMVPVETEIVAMNLTGGFGATLSSLSPSTTYYFRAKAAGDGAGYGDWKSFTTMAAPPMGGGGGPGGGGAGFSLTGLGGVGPLVDAFTSKTLNAVTLTTFDGDCSMSIPTGTVMKSALGLALNSLSVTSATPPSKPPPQSAIVINYDMGPDGATFSPPIGVTITYSESQLPAGASEADLYAAFWDGSAWVKLDSVVDSVANTITTKMSHFTNVAVILGAAKPATVAPTLSSSPSPAPAPAPAPKPAPLPESQQAAAPAPTPAPVPTQVPTPQPSPAPAVPAPAPAAAGQQPNRGLITGISAGVILLAILSYIMSRNRRRAKNTK